MYKRNEVIEEEDLEWNKKTKDTVQENDLEVTLPPEVKHEKLLIDEESSFENQSDKQSNVMAFFYKYEYLSLGLIILILPYLVGLLFNFVLFYIYSGTTLDKAFSIEKEHNILELWTIGVYAFVTSWIIWIILKTLNDNR
jgi:hypothetical protein